MKHLITSGSLSILWHCLSLGLEWKLTFSSPVTTAEFSKFADILSVALSQNHLSGFEIAQLEFPSPSLALFIVTHPKAHLTSHSRMSGSCWVWVITLLWCSGSWRSFLYSSSVYAYYLFLISTATVRSLPFLSFMEPIFSWNVPLVCLIFLKRSRLSHSVVFLYFFALIAEEAFLISPCYSLELCFQMKSFLFSGMVLILVSCTVSGISIHSSSGTLVYQI